jgi:hypothetical protein
MNNTKAKRKVKEFNAMKRDSILTSSYKKKANGNNLVVYLGGVSQTSRYSSYSHIRPNGVPNPVN